MRIYIRNIALSVLTIFLCISVFAQDDNDDTEIQNIIESIVEDQESEDFDYSDFIENLNYFQQHPINLNRADLEDLLELNVISEIEAQAIFNHIEKYGSLLSIFELQAIDGLDLYSIYKMLPFISVNENELGLWEHLQQKFYSFSVWWIFQNKLLPIVFKSSIFNCF